MATQILKDQEFWFDGYQLTSMMNALALEYAAELQDNTVFGMDTRSRIGGLKTVAANHQGFVDASDRDALLFNKIGVKDTPMSFAASNGAEGDVAYSFLATQGEYSPGASIGDIFAFSVSAEGSGKLIRGTLMEKNTGISSTGAGTARQLGAISSSQRMYAALHILGVDDPADTLDVTIESDSSNSFSGGETTRITFNQAGAIGAQWIELGGAVTDTWWRVAYTIAGDTPAFDFVVVIGIL